MDFSKDNIETLLILLCVTHLKFEDILKDTPSQELLIELAILYATYRCQNLLKPWVGGWIARNFRQKPELETPENRQTMMLLGRVFQPDGEVNYFDEAVSFLYGDTKEDYSNTTSRALASTSRYHGKDIESPYGDSQRHRGHRPRSTSNVSTTKKKRCVLSTKKKCKGRLFDAHKAELQNRPGSLSLGTCGGSDHGP
ncbi:uncharacterized protein LY89DRAFT_726005 [Mollisia scopiformis]|uniref:Uncharacterized protein n=1 Tax=Mollisia scopiformis TaxID=149040 RepID=A0A132B454_MOLSC|nr:uncharacterized protein LY89DRAFT_726005 [Mollisia scopiformis]KUJ07172.1 hypothetical protein LY89DRAFT_726005 [Mollisia scopiformis]